MKTFKQAFVIFLMSIFLFSFTSYAASKKKASIPNSPDLKCSKTTLASINHISAFSGRTDDTVPSSIRAEKDPLSPLGHKNQYKKSASDPFDVSAPRKSSRRKALSEDHLADIGTPLSFQSEYEDGPVVVLESHVTVSDDDSSSSSYDDSFLDGQFGPSFDGNPTGTDNFY